MTGRAGVAASALWLALGAAAAAAPSPFTPVPAETAPAGLDCPDRAGAFVLLSQGEGRCRYVLGLVRAELTRGEPETPPGDGAARLGSEREGSWTGEMFHLGETEDGDQRMEIWAAEAEGGALAVTLEYVTPQHEPGAGRLFLSAIGAPNGVRAGEENGGSADAACPDEISGFTLEHAVGTAEGGAAVLSGCAYLRGDIAALVYDARETEMALSAIFEDAVPTDGPAPDVPDVQSRVTELDGVLRGVWVWDAGDGVRAVEGSWTDEEQARQLQALIEAARGE